ncbi:phosphate ABC transporter permease subunit PstC [Bounagaea algeriensis]
MTDSTTAESRPQPPNSGGGGGSGHSTGPEDPIPSAASAERSVVRPGDRIFSSLARTAGAFVVALIAAIGLFLIIRAVPSLQENQVNFLFSREWDTSDPDDLSFGIIDLLWITVASSLVALVIAMPLAFCIALFLTMYAPRSLARPFAYIVDLLAAVPSVIYGLWGVMVLAPVINPAAAWLNNNLGWIPIFADGNIPADSGKNVFTAGIVLAVMILPIITGVTREVFQRTPSQQIEGALALGATKWEVVRTTVWPFGKNGFIGGSMLGLGRALGETVALTIVLSFTFEPPGYSVFDGGATFASKIALGSAEFLHDLQVGAYISAGLVLFVITFVVNALARWIEGGNSKGNE